MRTADTLAGLERRLSRDTLREFDARVLVQLGGNDSTGLIDSLAGPFDPTKYHDTYTEQLLDAGYQPATPASLLEPRVQLTFAGVASI